jgi:hypothetical protein
MNPVLADLVVQLDAADLDARNLVNGLTDTQVRWQPSQSQWSVVHCIEHLAISAEMYNRAFERALAKGIRASSSQPPRRDGFISRWLVKNIEPPPRTGIKTGRAYVPRLTAPMAETMGTLSRGTRGKP